MAEGNDNPNVPTFDAEELGSDIYEFYHSHAHIDTLVAIISGTDAVFQILAEKVDAADLPESNALTDWAEKLEDYGERHEWYIEAIENGDDPNDSEELVIPSFFEGDYGDDFEKHPTWPDVQTPWRLANEVMRLPDAEGEYTALTQEDLEDLVREFWQSVEQALIANDPGSADVSKKIAAAVEDAKKKSEETSDFISMRPVRPESKGASVAPLLLGLGALMLVARSKRR
jgi:hypothetical protein